MSMKAIRFISTGLGAVICAALLFIILSVAGAGCANSGGGVTDERVISPSTAPGAYTPWWVEDKVPNGAGTVVKPN